MPRKWSAELYVSDYKGPSQPTTPTSPASSASNDPFSPGQNEATDTLRSNLQVERQQFQKKLYTKWLNSKLHLAPGHPKINDLFEDLRDGRNLLLLLQVLTGKTLKPVKGNLRLHHLNNLTLALDVLRDYKVKLVGINNDSITDGDVTTTLGLCWSIMYYFQVVAAVDRSAGAKNAEEFLLKWCSGIVENYSHADVTSFQPKKWRKGYTLNALLHAFKPELFRYSDLTKMNSAGRMNHALLHAQNSFGVNPLFTVEEFNNGSVDSKALVLYVSSLYEQMKSMERPGFKEETEDDSAALYEQLDGLDKELTALHQKPMSEPSVNLTKENVTETETSFNDIQNSLHEINTNLNSAGSEINSSSSLKVDDKNKLQQKHSELVESSEKLRNKWEAYSNSIKQRFAEQLAKDKLLLSRWKEKSEKIESWLKSFEQPLSRHPQISNNDSAVFALSNEIEALSSKFSTEEVDIQKDIEFGNSLIRSQKLSNKMTEETIRRDIDEYIHRKAEISSLLMEEKTKLAAALDEQRHAESKALDDWLEKAAEVKRSLRAFELASQEKHGNSHVEIEQALKQQEQLLADLVQFYPNLKTLFSEGDILSKDWFSENKVVEMRQECASIDRFNKDIMGKIENNLARLKMQVDEENARENLQLSKWNDKSQVIGLWLDDMKEKVDHLSKTLVDEPIAIANYKNELESLSSKFDDEESSIEEDINFGKSLLKSGYIISKDNQNRLCNQLKDHTQRKSRLGNAIKNAKDKLSSLEKERELSESKELNTWMERASGARKVLMSFELAGEEQNAHSMDEVNSAIEELQRLLQDLNKFQPNLDELYANGEELSSHWSNQGRIQEMREVCISLNTLYKEVKESLVSANERLKQKLKEQNAKEDVTLSTWLKKSEGINSWLSSIEKTLSQLKSIPSQPGAIAAHTEQLEALSSKYNLEEGGVQNDIDFGSSLENTIQNKNKREQLHKEITSYNSRKAKLAGYLLEEKVKAVSVTEVQRANESKELNTWLGQAAAAKKTLRAYELAGQGRNVHTMEETKNAINELEKLLQQTKAYQPSLDAIYTDGDALAKNWSSPQKVDEIKQECESLERFSQNVNSVIQDTLERLKQKLDGQNAAEDMLLSRWKEKSEHINDWLNGMDEKCTQLQLAPIEASDMDVYSHDYEVLQSKYNTEEGVIQKEIEFGNSLLQNDDVQNEARKQQINSDVKKYNGQKSNLNEQLLKCRQKLEDAKVSQKQNEAKQFKDWWQKVVQIKQALKQLEESGKEKTVVTREDIQNALREQAKLLQNVDKCNPNVESLVVEGEKLSKTCTSKSNELRQESKALGVYVVSVRDEIEVVCKRYQKKLADLDKENEEHAGNILMRLKLFHDWIQFAKQQLEFIKISSSSPLNFKDLVQREQGLNKLSADMDSRADELSEFTNLMSDFSDNGKELSLKDRELLEKIRILQNDWNYVIDSTDQEFKNLYDTINSLVDKKRGEIEKALKLVQKQLNQIENYDRNKDKLNEVSNVYMEVSNELSKLKAPIQSLSQHTDALNDVSIFVDDEKEVMRHASGELQLQYVKCRDKTEEMKKRIHEDIICYVQETCQESSNHIKQIQEEGVPLESVDQNDLASMKNFLKSEQKGAEEIKAEHFKIDDLEQFAEGTASFGVVSPEDQVAVANTINETLKEIENAQKQKKAKISRIYAIAYHTLNQDLQHLINRLHKANDEIDEIKNADIRDYEQAVDVMKLMKKNEDELQSLKQEKEDLLGDLKQVESILDPSDVKQLHSHEETFDRDFSASTKALEKEKNKMGKKIDSLTDKKLDSFMGWYPIMKKRSEEPSDVGPDSAAIDKQLQEVLIIEQQANSHSFAPLFEEDGELVLQQIDEDKHEDIKAAHHDWKKIKEWLSNRKKELDEAKRIWDEFDNSCLDLSDYLRQTDKEINTWNNLDLNDDESVENQKELLKNSLIAMETRKPHAMKLNDVTGRLLDFIGDDSQTANKVRSQVADVFDVWNNLCKKNIENTSKLAKSHKQFKNLENKVKEIRDWVTATVVVLEELSNDENDIEESIKKVDLKRSEHEEYQEKMDDVLQLSDKLSSDPDTVGHFTINEDVELLHRDFQGVTNELERLQKFLSRAKLFFRRARQSFKKKLASDERPVDGVMDDVSSQVSHDSIDEIPEQQFPQQQTSQPIAVN